MKTWRVIMDVTYYKHLGAKKAWDEIVRTAMASGMKNDFYVRENAKIRITVANYPIQFDENYLLWDICPAPYLESREKR